MWKTSVRTLLSPYLTFFLSILIRLHFQASDSPYLIAASQYHHCWWQCWWEHVSMATVAKHTDAKKWGLCARENCWCQGESACSRQQRCSSDLNKATQDFIIMACLFIGPAYLQCLHWGALQCKLGLRAIYYAKTEYEIFSISVTFVRSEKCMKHTLSPSCCDSSTHIKQCQINGSRDELSKKLHRPTYCSSATVSHYLIIWGFRFQPITAAITSRFKSSSWTMVCVCWKSCIVSRYHEPKGDPELELFPEPSSHWSLCVTADLVGNAEVGLVSLRLHPSPSVSSSQLLRRLMASWLCLTFTPPHSSW